LHPSTETVVNTNELALPPAAPSFEPESLEVEAPEPGTEAPAPDLPASAAWPASAEDPAAATAGARPGPGAGPSNADLLAGLGRRFRGPTLRMSFELRTAIARQIFRRDFVYVSQQLHALEASRRVQGLSRENLNAALSAVGQRIDEVRTQLRDDTAHRLDQIELHGHADADVEFARPAALQVTIVSPLARDFMDVLVHADDALTQLERAWLLGLIEPAEKGRQSGEVRKAVQSVKEMVRIQRQWIGAQVRELNARRGVAEPTLAGDAGDPEDAPEAAIPAAFLDPEADPPCTGDPIVA
jgi:hypothetical protein